MDNWRAEALSKEGTTQLQLMACLLATEAQNSQIIHLLREVKTGGLGRKGFGKFSTKKKSCAGQNKLLPAESVPFMIPALALSCNVTQLPSICLGSKGTGSDWLSWSPMFLRRITQWLLVSREMERVVPKEEGLTRSCEPLCRGRGKVELLMAFQCQWDLDHQGEQLSTASKTKD